MERGRGSAWWPGPLEDADGIDQEAQGGPDEKVSGGGDEGEQGEGEGGEMVHARRKVRSMGTREGSIMATIMRGPHGEEHGGGFEPGLIAHAHPGHGHGPVAGHTHATGHGPAPVDGGGGAGEEEEGGEREEGPVGAALGW